MPHQGLLLFRMAPLCMLLGMLMVSCFKFCHCHKNSEFALTNPEKSSTKETERKETITEEELEPQILEVFHPTHEWQALRPGAKVIRRRKGEEKCTKRDRKAPREREVL